MDEINLNEYELKEIITERNTAYDEQLRYLLEILNNRSIPEENKKEVREQFNYILKLIDITTKPPKIILQRK